MRFLQFAAIALAAAIGYGAEEETALAAWKKAIREQQPRQAEAFVLLMEGVQELEVFTLDHSSRWDNEEKRAKDASPRLSRWKITGRAKVTDAREIARLRQGIRRSIATGGPMAACFEPRHGIRFAKNGHPIELILCFECGSMETVGSTEFKHAAISSFAERDFYFVLRAHGLTKPTKLNGRSDAELAKLLAGDWTGVDTEHRGGRLVKSEVRTTYAADGDYHNEGEGTMGTDSDGKDIGIQIKDRGRWRIEDGLLLLSLAREDGEDSLNDGPIEKANVVLEAAPDRIVLGSTSPDSDQETVLQRK